MSIELQNVYYSYKNQQEYTLQDINLYIENQGLTAIMGSNGSGKTTLGKLMGGILKPDKGRVLILGQDTKKMSLGKIGTQIGYMFQEPDRQIFAPTVEEELSFIMNIKGFDKKLTKDKVEEMLKKFHLNHLKESFPFQLSRGEKQRLVLAAILINQPKFLILDEPTTALDVKRKQELSQIIKELLLQGVGMVIISHDNKFISQHADRVIEVDRGEIRSENKSQAI